RRPLYAYAEGALSLWMDRGLRICSVETSDESAARDLERRAITALDPMFNRAGIKVGPDSWRFARDVVEEGLEDTWDFASNLRAWALKNGDPVLAADAEHDLLLKLDDEDHVARAEVGPPIDDDADDPDRVLRLPGGSLDGLTLPPMWYGLA